MPRTVTIEVRSHGASVHVCAHAGVEDALRAGLAPHTSIGVIERTGAARPCDERIEADPARTEAELVSQVRLAIAAHARPAVFVHAGAVCWRGVGVILPGRSMSGKSTLVRALVQQGATYFSDEYAVLHDHGRLAPYAKPLSIRVPGQPNLSVDPRSIGDVGREPVVVGLVAALHHAPDAPWPPEEQLGAAAALPLVENTVAARLAPDRMLDAIAGVLEHARCVVGPRPDAPAAATKLLAMVDDLVASRAG